MRRTPLPLLLITAGCAAQPSAWEPRLPSNAPKISCACDGFERGPKPDEASSDRDPRIIIAVCEGKVHDCKPWSERRRHNGHNQLD